MDDETVVIEASHSLCTVFSNGTSVVDLRKLLGDPLETVIIRETVSREPIPCRDEVEAFIPRTKLGRQLLEIRGKAISNGEAPVSLEDLECELAELRMDPEDYLE